MLCLKIHFLAQSPIPPYRPSVRRVQSCRRRCDSSDRVLLCDVVLGGQVDEEVGVLVDVVGGGVGVGVVGEEGVVAGSRGVAGFAVGQGSVSLSGKKEKQFFLLFKPCYSNLGFDNFIKMLVTSPKMLKKGSNFILRSAHNWCIPSKQVQRVCVSPMTVFNTKNQDFLTTYINKTDKSDQYLVHFNLFKQIL